MRKSLVRKDWLEEFVRCTFLPWLLACTLIVVVARICKTSACMNSGADDRIGGNRGSNCSRFWCVHDDGDTVATWCRYCGAFDELGLWRYQSIQISCCQICNQRRGSLFVISNGVIDQIQLTNKAPKVFRSVRWLPSILLTIRVDKERSDVCMQWDFYSCWMWGGFVSWIPCYPPLAFSDGNCKIKFGDVGTKIGTGRLNGPLERWISPLQQKWF